MICVYAYLSFRSAYYILFSYRYWQASSLHLKLSLIGVNQYAGILIAKKIIVSLFLSHCDESIPFSKELKI